jgi:hemerythrin superfamily protein
MIRQALGRLKTASKKVIRSELDALDLFRSDHMRIEALLMQLRFSQEAEHRSALLRKVRTELFRHMRLEEEIFYPACAAHEDLKSFAENALEDHREIRDLFKELGELDPTERRFGARVTQLIRAVERHVVQEEDRIFPLVRDELEEKEFARFNREIIRKHREAESPARKPRKAA